MATNNSNNLIHDHRVREIEDLVYQLYEQKLYYKTHGELYDIYKNLPMEDPSMTNETDIMSNYMKMTKELDKFETEDDRRHILVCYIALDRAIRHRIMLLRNLE